MADAAGPDTFSFEALFRLLASSMGVRRWFLHTPPRVGLALTGLVGLLMRDMVLTNDEVDGLMAGLLTSEVAPTGTTRLSDWLDRERGRPRETVRVRASAELPWVGMARDLARAGIGLTSLMNAGCWRTATMPAHCTRNEAAGKGAVAQFHGYCRRAAESGEAVR